MSESPATSGDRGIAFPSVDGVRSTSATGRAVFADAARAADPELADEVASSDRWYRAYMRCARRLTEAEITRDLPGDAVPQAGLASVHDRFRFVLDGDSVPVGEALAAGSPGSLSTATVRGRGPGGAPALRVPYRGELLSGDALHRTLDRWVGTGVVEASFAGAVRRVMANPDWLDLSDLTFVLLGAGAEMGPLEALSSWGARMALVDLPQPGLWGRILDMVTNGRGLAHVPVASRPGAGTTGEVVEVAGADLVIDLPDLAAWLDTLGNGPIVVGNHVYAHGRRNVQASVAVDALTAHLIERRGDVSLAVLATPTDTYAVPDEIRQASVRRLSSASWSSRLLRAVSGGRLYAPNYTAPVASPAGRLYGVADGLVPQQGPNYALAKRIQRWRARLARHRGLLSSIHVAPPTATVSVTSQRLLAAAYRGAPSFGVGIFEPATSRTLLAALLVRDLRDPRSPAHPGVTLDHPLDMLHDAAAHGGLWRIPFLPRSVLPVAALRGMASRR